MELSTVLFDKDDAEVVAECGHPKRRRFRSVHMIGSFACTFCCRAGVDIEDINSLVRVRFCAVPLAFAASSVERIASKSAGLDMIGVTWSAVSPISVYRPGAQPPSPTQKRLRQTTRIHQGSATSHTDATKTPLHQVINMFTT